MFATKPKLAGTLLARAHQRGIRAAFTAGDEVTATEQLRPRDPRPRHGVCAAVRANHTLTASSGRAMTAAQAARLIPATPEMLRMLTRHRLPPPRRDHAHRQHWSQWRRRHQYRASQAHRRWNA